jgi:hypothetical protein
MSSAATQRAIYERLAGDYDVTSLVQAVYDHVPQDAAFPYVVIGDSTEAQWDTDDSTGTEATVTIHVWSRFRGRSETKLIQDAIYQSLHRYDLPIDGVHTVTVEWEYAESFLDPDGLTRHGVQRFRIISENE